MQTTNIKNSTLILHKSFTQFQSNEAEARHQSQEEFLLEGFTKQFDKTCMYTSQQQSKPATPKHINYS